MVLRIVLKTIIRIFSKETGEIFSQEVFHDCYDNYEHYIDENMEKFIIIERNQNKPNSVNYFSVSLWKRNHNKPNSVKFIENYELFKSHVVKDILFEFWRVRLKFRKHVKECDKDIADIVIFLFQMLILKVNCHIARDKDITRLIFMNSNAIEYLYVFPFQALILKIIHCHHMILPFMVKIMVIVYIFHMIDCKYLNISEVLIGK